MLKILQSKPIFSICVIVIVMLAFSVDSIPVSIMEARNFVTAREMITDGHWILTTMNGEARYEKPPLPTWITAIFGLIFGLKSLIALRFPTIIFISIIGIFTYLLSKRILSDKTHSLINGLIVITSFYVIGITLEAPWDIFTHGFMLIGIYHLFQFFEKESNYTINVLLAGIFIGCSILCKGPISIYALMLPFLIAYGFTFRFKNFKSKIIPLIGCIVAAIIIGGWWYIYVRFNDPLTFEKIATKETNNWHSYNTKPFYFYWSFFTQSGIWTIPSFISLFYPYLKNRVSNLKAYQFTLIWTLLAVVLLSLVPEKKSRYLMPVLIPLAMNCGFYIEYLIRKFKILTKKNETLPVYLNFGLIALISIAIPVIVYVVVGEQIADHIFRFIIVSITTVLIGVSIFIKLKQKQIDQVFLLTVAFFVVLFFSALPLLKPVIGKANNPITNLGHQNIELYGFSNVSPEIIWQYGQKIPQIKLEDGSVKFPENNQFGILAHNLSDKDSILIRENYHMEKVNRFDLNTVDEDSRRYNNRLINDFYILTRY